MIKYIGSKRLLVDSILSALADLPQHAAVLDVFSGTSRVGQVLKRAGFEVSANDHNAYAATIARCYIEADRRLWLAPATTLIASLSKVPPKAGWFTKTYCEDSRFFHPDNGARVDAIRAHIDTLNLAEPLRSIALISLMEAADRVDSTTGVQMAYLKQWAKRAHKPLQLRLPKLLPRAAAGKGKAHQMEPLEAARQLRADVVYLDPPYNQHKYMGNYHIWESLVRWDKPEVYGIACKRVDVRERKSAFNSKPKFRAHFEELVQSVDCLHLLLSFSNEGYLSKDDMLEILSQRGEVRVIETDFKRYVGAQIGIHSPSGKKVGAVSHTRNKEFLFVVSA